MARRFYSEQRKLQGICHKNRVGLRVVLHRSLIKVTAATRSAGPPLRKVTGIEPGATACHPDLVWLASDTPSVCVGGLFDAYRKRLIK
jgi:hypothetical protein